MKYAVPPEEFDLKDWRERNKLSLRDLAKLVKIHHSHLFRIENGDYVASTKTAQKIFKITNSY